MASEQTIAKPTSIKGTGGKSDACAWKAIEITSGDDLEAMETREARPRGVGKVLAAQTAGSPHGPWRVANSPALSVALPLAYFDSLALPRLFDGLCLSL